MSEAGAVPLSTRNAESAQRYADALALLHDFRGNPRSVIDAALERDPDFVGGYCMRAAQLVLDGARNADGLLAAAIGAIDARRTFANERERRHAEAARAWLARKPQRAARLYGDLVVDYPLDTIALQLAHAFDFHLGRSEMLRDRIAQVLPHWHRGMPGHDFVRTLYAFGLGENGAHDEAEATAREALRNSPANAGATHVIAHVIEMRGRPADGVAFLRGTEGVWARETAFAVHNAWHLALFHLENDEPERALAVHDERIASADPGQVSALVDSSALLWRLMLRGVRTEGRWSALASRWEGVVESQRRVFTLAHAMMAYALARRDDGIQCLLEALAEREVSDINSRETRRLAALVCEAIRSFAAADYAAAVERLTRVRHLSQRCGGSIAQCDLIHLTLVEAALRDRRSRLARALAAERTARRPDSRLNDWLAARALAVG